MNLLLEKLMSRLIYLILLNKADLKDISHINISNFALKSNLANLKTEINKLDIDKLTPVPNDLAKRSTVVKNDVIKKTEYNKLVTKVDNNILQILLKKTNIKNMDQVLKIKSVR